MVWLQPVVDLVGEFVLNALARHASLIDKKFEDEDFVEACFNALNLLIGRWNVLSKIDIRATWQLTVLARRLVSMAAIQTEHQRIGNLVEERYVFAELLVIGRKRFSKINLNEFVEFFSALSTV